MPQSLAPIPLAVPIVDRLGNITDFFRLRWQELIDGALLTPTRQALPLAVSTAALATTVVLTVLQGGNYRLSTYVQKTVAAGIASSLTVTYGWTSNGVPCTKTFAALTTDAIGANDSTPWTFYADANSDITVAVAYVSNPVSTMAWLGEVVLEQLA